MAYLEDAGLDVWRATRQAKKDAETYEGDEENHPYNLIIAEFIQLYDWIDQHKVEILMLKGEIPERIEG